LQTQNLQINNDYSTYIHKSRYARWLDKEGRRETWEETVKRYCDFWQQRYPETFPYNDVYTAIYNKEVMPSMRALMTAGPALERDNIAGFNCSYIPVDDVRAFDEIMYILMNGTGVGYSVERQDIQKLPEVAEQFHYTDTIIHVADSKTGWSAAFRQLISLLYQGQIAKWDTTKVRPAGARLKTFGGRASGPAPLEDLFRFTVSLFTKAAGRKLTSVECSDLVCKTAEVVVVGGVRRSALICLSNLSDDRMRNYKNGQWYVDGAGFVVFKDRHDRLQKIVPSVIFGDGSGEVPYAGEDLVINFDPSYVINNVNITRQGGSTASVQDSESVASYYPRVYNRTTESLEDSDTSEAAYFILSRYKDPHARPETLTLTPARNPAIWATCLNIEIGDLVRVNKRPLGASPISIDCFVERVEHEFDAQSGDWVTKVILSPTIVYYWNLTSFLGSTVSSTAVNRVFARQDQTSANLGMRTRFSLIGGQLLQYNRINATPRTNLVNNPNFELNANGWTSSQTGGVTRSTAFAQTGTGSGIITWSSSVDSVAFTFGTANHIYPKTGSYTMSAYVYVPTGSTLAGRTITLTQEGGTATVTSTSSTPATLVAATWVRVSQTVNVTVAGSTNAVFRLSGTLSTAVGQTIYIDSVMEENLGTLGTYFDGASEAAYWNGTINNSISIIPSEANYVEVIGSAITGTTNFTVPTVRVGTFTNTSSQIYRTTLAQDLEPDLGTFGTVNATLCSGTGTEVRVDALHNFKVGDTVMLSGFTTAAYNTTTPVTITEISGVTGRFYDGFKFKSTATGLTSAGTVRAAVLLSDHAMVSSGATRFWVNNEVLTGITSGNVLEITGRNTYGNNTSYAFSGTPIIAVANTPAGIVPNGLVMYEYLPNQLVRVPYTVPNPTLYNPYSILGSWTGSLSTGTYTTVTPASGIKYNTISLNALVDKDNYPASDLMSGQIINLNNGTTSELFAIVSTTAPAVGTGVWQATGYKVAASQQTVGTTNNVLAGDTSITLSGAVTASAILIDGEFMQVTAGSGTSTLTVVRGTPDAAVWDVLTLSPHSSSIRVYTIVNAGLTGTYAAGNVVSEGIVSSTGTTSVYSGTARLGY